MARSSRFDAALRDLAAIYSDSGWVCKGDLQKIASRHSDTPEEREALLAHLEQMPGVRSAS